MILKASSRANGFDLAVHLMNGYDNEQVDIAEVRGTIADDLYGAFAEFEAIASGTKAKKPLYSLSMNPAEKLTRAQYAEAIDAIEGKLGLTGQPRIIVFHVKDGREHAHIVWSRINAAEMKAVHMSYDHSKLMDMAVQLAEKFGHNLPDGLKAWKKGETFSKEKLETNLQENVNAKKTGITAEERRAEITAAYNAADSAAATQNALEEKGYILARGDKRAIVFVDRFGDAYSLSRYVKGITRKEYRGRMDALPLDRLPSVAEARAEQRARQKASEERAREQHRPRQRMESHGADDPGRREFEAFKRSVAEKQAAMEKARAARGLALTQAEQKLLLSQQQERMALHAAQKAEARGLFFKVRARVAELVVGSPALQSVLGRITERVGLDPRDRHKLENEALDRRHARENRASMASAKGWRRSHSARRPPSGAT